MARKNTLLPKEFADLEDLAANWALAEEKDRVYRRKNSSIEEMKAFYDVMLVRVDDVMAHLNQFPLDALPADARNLLNLCLSFAEVSTSVEYFNQPEVIYGFDPTRFLPDVDVQTRYNRGTGLVS